jgi:serine/threonine-protein kinase PknK
MPLRLVLADDAALIRRACGCQRWQCRAGVPRERFPAVGILLLSTHTEIDDAVELFSATASSVGYLLKDSVSDLDELTGALTRISEGGTVFDPKLVVELLGRARRADPLDVLTPREREVVGLMAEGQSNTGIAQTLWITHGAVEKHIKHILLARAPGR